MNTDEPTPAYDVLHTPPARITEFQLNLADGTDVDIPCTEISHLDGITVLAAAIHHLIQRVADLEANREEHMRKVYPQLFPDSGEWPMTPTKDNK